MHEVDRLPPMEMLQRFVKAYAAAHAAATSGTSAEEKLATACVMVVMSVAPPGATPTQVASDAEFVAAVVADALRTIARSLSPQLLPSPMLRAKINEAVNTYIVKATLDGGSV